MDLLFKDKDFFKEFEEMLQESGRPYNIKQLMKHGFKYYFRDNKALYFADLIKGGRCSQNEDNNKSFGGYFVLDDKTLYKRFLGETIHRRKGESEEQFKEREKELKQRKIKISRYHIYADVFFNFNINKKYDPTNEKDKNKLLEYIKEFIKNILGDIKKVADFKDTKKELFNSYIKNFTEELKQADLNNINVFISFVISAPTFESFILNTSLPTPTNDIHEYIKSVVEYFNKQKEAYESQIKALEEDFFKDFDSTAENIEKLEKLAKGIYERFEYGELTQEESDFLQQEDKSLSLDKNERTKQYLLLHYFYGNKEYYFLEKIEAYYKDFIATKEEEELFKKIFTCELNAVVIKGRNFTFTNLIDLVAVCRKPQISESDLIIYIDPNTSKEEQEQLKARLKSANKEDIEKIVAWKRADNYRIKLENDLKALNTEYRQAQKEDKDTSYIKEQINFTQAKLKNADEEAEEKHKNIILYNGKYYINKGKYDTIQNAEESGKVEIANKQRTFILKIDSKTAIKEDELTTTVFMWLLLKLTQAGKNEVIIKDEEINKTLKMLGLIADENEKDKNKLYKARHNFEEQLRLLNGKVIDYSVCDDFKGIEPLIMPIKRKGFYLIRLASLLYPKLDIGKEYYLPVKIYDEYTLTASNFLFAFKRYQTSHPLNTNRNEFTIKDILDQESYNYYVRREDYTGKDYNRDVLKAVKDQMKTVIKENAGIFYKDKIALTLADIDKLNENDKIEFIPANETEKQKNYLKFSHDKAIKQIETRRAKSKSKKKK